MLKNLKIYKSVSNSLIEEGINKNRLGFDIIVNVKKVKKDEYSFDCIHLPLSNYTDLNGIKNLIINYYNSLCDKEILSGFTYEDVPVWLSTENQTNFKAAYDLAVQMQGENGTLPLKFKFGTDKEPVYRVFDNLPELTQFYTSAIGYIRSTLEKYWDIKDEINWSKYEIKTEE